MKKTMMGSVYSGTKYGYIGQKTNFDGFCVGDIVALDFHGRVHSGIVFANGNTGEFGIMGMLSTPLRKHRDLRLVLSHKFVTPDIVKTFASHVTFKEEEVQKMTKAQIEQKLGYAIEIVGEK